MNYLYQLLCQASCRAIVKQRHTGTCNQRRSVTHALRGSLAAILFMVALLCSSTAAALSEDWKLIQDVQGVKIYYKIAHCNGPAFFLLQIVNGSGAQVHGSWNIKIETGMEKIYLTGVLIDLKAGITQTGSCDDPMPDLVFPIPLPLMVPDLKVTIETNFQ